MPNDRCDKSRPDSAYSSGMSSSSDSEPQSTEQRGYDEIEMSFILGDQSKENENSSSAHRRQFHRQFGMATECTGVYSKQEAGEDISSNCDKNKEDADQSEMDMYTCDTEEDEEKSAKDSEGGWVTDDEVPELPPKRIKTSNTDSDSNDTSSDDENSSSDGDQSNGSGVDMSAFFDSNDPVCSYPSKPIKLTTEEIADYKQDECGGSKYYNFGSEDMGFDSYFDALAHQCESDDDDDDYFCMTCYSMSAGQTYAFPRVTPRRIEQLVKFWENDFQVGNLVYPCMGSWESKGIAPNRMFDPASDCRKYSAFKVLFRKWLECNQSREQWYRKYRGHSLLDIANGRVETCIKKQRTDSTFRSVCPVDIAAQSWSQNQCFGSRQRPSLYSRQPNRRLSSARVF